MEKKLTLSKLYFKNYRNLIAEDGLKLNNLNICIGPNGSGKSNMIAVLQFFKEALISSPDENRGITGFEDAIQKLGGSNILDKTVEAPAVVQFKVEFDPSYEVPDNICFELELMIKGKFHDTVIKRESFSALQSSLGHYDTFQYYDTESEVDITADSEKAKHLQLVRRLLNVNVISKRVPPEVTPFYDAYSRTLESMFSWYFYKANNMNLKSIRISEPKIGKSDRFLASSGENLALVFENITQQDIDFEDRINLAMKQILPQTRKVRAIRSGRLSLIIEWYFDNIKQPFYLDEMSDGTVRMLCWAVILHSPVLPSLLVIDEPEIGIHPAWMSILAEWIKTASQKTQIIISTHSSDLLDYFTDCLENVLCFDYDGKSHFRIKRLSKERLAPSLEQGWQLGDLYRVGDPEVGGWPW